MDPLQVTSGLCGQRVIYSHIIQMRLFYRTNAVCTTRNPSFLLVVVVRLSNRFNNPIVLLGRTGTFSFLPQFVCILPFPFSILLLFPRFLYLRQSHAFQVCHFRSRLLSSRLYAFSFLWVRQVWDKDYEECFLMW